MDIQCTTIHGIISGQRSKQSNFDKNQTCFAFSFPKGSAAIWRYKNVSFGIVPSTQNDSKYAVSQGFIPRDHSKRVRDRIRNLKQPRSVAKYLDNFLDIVFTINGMQEDEKIDRFIHGLKQHVRIEVLKRQAEPLDESTRIAFNVNSAIWRASGFSHENGNHSNGNRHTPTNFRLRDKSMLMKIGNVLHGKLFRAQREQRLKDMEIGACC